MRKIPNVWPNKGDGTDAEVWESYVVEHRGRLIDRDYQAPLLPLEDLTALIKGGWEAVPRDQIPANWKTKHGRRPGPKPESVLEKRHEADLVRNGIARPYRERSREEHAAVMRARSRSLRIKQGYLRNTTPEQRSQIARNAWEHRRDRMAWLPEDFAKGRVA